MATKYDPDLLQQYADRLYRRARWVTGWYGVVGLVLGGIFDLMLFTLMAPGTQRGAPTGGGVWIMPLIGVLIGYVYGSGKAYELRLDAQRTLCQLQIERNTRPASPTATGGA